MDSVKPEDLVSVGQIAEMCNVEVSAVSNWQSRDIGFPEPWGSWGPRFNLFLREEVEAWWSDRMVRATVSVDKKIEILEAQLKKLKERK